LHPRYLFGALEPTYYEGYKERNRLRALECYKAMSNMMIKNSLVKIKDHPPYTTDLEAKVLLNSLARATFDPKTGVYSFKGELASEVSPDVSNVKALTDIAAAGGIKAASENPIGIGVDQGLCLVLAQNNLPNLAINFRINIGCPVTQFDFCLSEFHGCRDSVLSISTLSPLVFCGSLGW
jgi:fatty acid synthase subunit alpha